MPENFGLYQKYRVERHDGKPVAGPVFVLDLGSDPVHSAAALAAYADSCRVALPWLAGELDVLVQELRRGEPGPAHLCLSRPRGGA